MGARLTPWPAAVACPERPASARAAVPLRVIADQSQRLEPPQVSANFDTPSKVCWSTGIANR